MIYCINPKCEQQENPSHINYCQTCGSELLLKGRYRVLHHLKTGGFGETYEVDDRGTKKVLKVLRQEQFPHPEQRKKVVALFKQESEVLSQLHHPGIPQVEPDSYFTYLPHNSQKQPLHCLVMEKIDGLNLHEWLNQRNYEPINQEQAINWLTQLVGILNLLHPQYFHRDIKPSNIMLKPDGRLVLIDFGSIREVTATYIGKLPSNDITMICSPGYAPLEQIEGQAVAQSDFFALGRTFVYLLTGTDIRELREEAETGKLIWREQAPQISEALKDLLDWFMEAKIEARPQNTQEILQHLEIIPSENWELPTQISVQHPHPITTHYPETALPPENNQNKIPNSPLPVVTATLSNYCINPKCHQRQNPANLEFCQTCNAPLLIKNRYRLISYLRTPKALDNAELFEVEDLGSEAVIGSRYKVLKVLKNNASLVVNLFKQEAEILKNLDHPGIPKVKPGDGYFSWDISCQSKQQKTQRKNKPLHCLVMEKIPGTNLADWLKQQQNGKIDYHLAYQWLVKILEIVDYLHKKQYFHRDIKPSNIILQPNGQLVLVDFGTAREITRTVVEILLGTDVIGAGIRSEGYTPLEQKEGMAVPQSDFYALGRTLVHLLTGIPPIHLEEDSKTGKLKWQDHAKPIPEALANWLDYLMEPDFRNRPPNAAFILEKLRNKNIENLPSPPAIVQSTTTRNKPARFWLKILNFGLFSIVLITGLLWLQARQEFYEREPKKLFKGASEVRIVKTRRLEEEKILENGKVRVVVARWI